jgi:hypothetical protein
MNLKPQDFKIIVEYNSIGDQSARCLIVLTTTVTNCSNLTRVYGASRSARAKVYPDHHPIDLALRVQVIAAWHAAERATSLGVFPDDRQCQFRKPAVPGDTLEYRADKIMRRRNMCWYRTEVEVGGASIVEAEVGAMITDANVPLPPAQSNGFTHWRARRCAISVGHHSCYQQVCITRARASTRTGNALPIAKVA